jgi:hypothetical protein
MLASLSRCKDAMLASLDITKIYPGLRDASIASLPG